jgi:protein-S-isoprenylcysteine O-methyltransferase Ste14
MPWLILAVLFWGFLHSLMASLEVKDLARRRLGERFMRFYRLAYNLFAGLTFLPIAAFYFLIPDHALYEIRPPWSILMLAGQILAGLALMIGFLQSYPLEFIGICQLGSPIEEPPHLRTDGLYRFVRHPLYTASLFLIWLLPTMTVNRLAVIGAATLYILVGAMIEERKLLHEFGPEYMDYTAVTPMLIPFLRGNKRGGSAST